MLAWSYRFATNIELVDTQHKKLFDLLNVLSDCFDKEGPSEAMVDDAINQLVSYADKHFTEEEELMKEHRIDPRHFDIHHLEHKSFMYDVERLRNYMSIDEAAEELVSFITSWLTYHILSVDQVMAAQIAAIQSGTSPEQAYDDHHIFPYDAVVTRMMLNSVLVLWRNSMDRCYKLEDEMTALQAKLNQSTRK